MQRKIYEVIIGIIVGAFALSSANAQTTTTTAVPFQLISPDARSSGMGDVGTGIADNANAIYWNPSGLAFQTGKEVVLTHSQWLPQFNSDLYYEYATFKWNNEESFGGTIGAQIIFLNLGKFIYTTESSPDPLGEFHSFGPLVREGISIKCANVLKGLRGVVAYATTPLRWVIGYFVGPGGARVYGEFGTDARVYG